MAQKLFGEQLANDLALLSKNLEVHEKVCYERWQMVCARLKRLEVIVMSSTAFLICTLISVIVLKKI